ncbi:hypothetical protein PU629_19670 [Pullulanibacillus sp. KACC 23026]|uniref:hypothetical protein n=1 Tax=Pullulanibacillus sp. KACC 23026 TaxID=3028315 RepID=UPI0023B0B29E|nr:hypothetical protein [Pullulanibacillus sp. KACC 23026]WEG12288.1 hypothetical protein PU629_19670 [Pullulanibacillus sp. KACC 23026]
MKFKFKGGIVMGRATESKSEQIKYFQTRLKLIADMAASLGEDATSEDLSNLMNQIEGVGVKLNRFKKDWEKQTSED